MRKLNRESKTQISAAVKSGPSVEGKQGYSQELIPMVGANFSALASLNATTDALTNGAALGTAVRFSTMVHMPVDKYNSFEAKMAEMYAEIREMNAGAANYTYLDLSAYVLNLLNIRAWAHCIMRIMNAFRATMPNSADSPYILTAVCGIEEFSTSESGLANAFNELAVLVKDIDNLPIPPMAVFDRLETLYSKLYADSPREKPALFAFLPQWIMIPTVESGDLKFTYQHIGNLGATLTHWVAALRAQYMNVATQNVYTILRGDLRKAFGSQAYTRPLTPFLTKPLEVQYLTGDVLAQVENATTVCAPADQAANVTLTRDATTKIWGITVPWGSSGKVAMKGEFPEQLINYHGAHPDVAATLQITRLMPVMDWIDPLLETKKLVVSADSGDTIVNVAIITAVTRDHADTLQLAALTADAQNSVVQSTAMAAFRDLAFVASVARGFPMIVTDDESPRGYIWNLDNFAVVSKTELNTYHERAIRSWYSAHLPRGELGRVERHP